MLTRRLHIFNATIPHLRSLVASRTHFIDSFDITPEPGFEGLPESLGYALWMLDRGAVDPVWWMYFFVHRERKRLIGSGGFQGGPDDSGIVEIGYTISPSYRGRGYGTEAARALVNMAFGFSKVKGIRAKTVSAPNASIRVLEKCGFCFDQELMDEYNGVIWHWIKRRPSGY